LYWDKSSAAGAALVEADAVLVDVPAVSAKRGEIRERKSTGRRSFFMRRGWGEIGWRRREKGI
jgi:hypothetical protein